MKKLIALVLALVCVFSMVACSKYNVTYTLDLSQYPAAEKRMGHGKIIEITDGKLLVAPVLDKDKAEFGEVVWLINDWAEAYTVGHVVTYTFCDVKAPDKKGDPLNIIALLVYME